MTNLGVLVSGNGSNLQAILDAIQSGILQAKVCVVISDKASAFALSRAEKFGVKSVVIEKKNFSSKEEFEKALVKELKNAGVQLVILAGFMKILGPTFLNEFPKKVLNIHPSLLPSFPGLHAIEQAFNHKVKVTGVTVHFVDEGCDTGPIIAQKAVNIEASDSLESLEKKIHQVEHQLYVEVLKDLTIKINETC